jgi:hypothetical protein
LRQVELAAEMSAKVLSDLLGISIESAVSWTQEAGHTRPAHVAEVAPRRG